LLSLTGSGQRIENFPSLAYNHTKAEAFVDGLLGMDFPVAITIIAGDEIIIN